MGVPGFSGVAEEKDKLSGTKGNKKRRCGITASTGNKQLERLLDQLPKFLAPANQAAEAFTRALSKWERKCELTSSSDAG